MGKRKKYTEARRDHMKPPPLNRAIPMSSRRPLPYICKPIHLCLACTRGMLPCWPPFGTTGRSFAGVTSAPLNHLDWLPRSHNDSLGIDRPSHEATAIVGQSFLPSREARSIRLQSFFLPGKADANAPFAFTLRTKARRFHLNRSRYVALPPNTSVSGQNRPVVGA